MTKTKPIKPASKAAGKTTTKTAGNPASKAAPAVLPGEEFQYLKLTDIEPDKDQPRKSFDHAKLAELTESIRERGVDTPILVRPVAGKKPYRLVFGERRWRASQAAGAKTIPARIRQMTDAQAAESQLVENTQRDDMTPMEEAQAFETLRKTHGYSIDELVLKSGKTEKLVRQRLRLVELPPAAQKALLDGQMRLGVANAIMWVDNADDRAAAAHHIITSSWEKLMQDVHAAEEYIRRNYLLQLSKAPFNTRDAKLLPAAGSCLNCPKRTGAAPALFQDLGVKDSCKDRGCYQQKVQLHRAQQIEKLSEKHTVLDEEDAKKVFRFGQDHVDSSSGFVELKDAVYQDKKHRSWGELVGPEAPIVVAVNESGKTFKLIKRTDAVRLAKEVSDVQLDLPATRGGNGGDALARKQAKARGQALAEYMVSLTAYIEAVTRDKFNPEHISLFRLLAKVALQNAPSECCRFMFKRRELPNLTSKFGGADHKGALEIALAEMQGAHNVLAFLIELLVLEDFQFWASASSNGTVDELQGELASFIGFDLKESVKDFLKKLTAPQASRKTKAAAQPNA